MRYRVNRDNADRFSKYAFAFQYNWVVYDSSTGENVSRHKNEKDAQGKADELNNA